MTTVILWVLMALVVLKDFAYIWGIFNFLKHGGTYRAEMEHGRSALMLDAPATINPVDRMLRGVIVRGRSRHPRASTAVLALFTTPAVVTLTTGGVFAVGRSGGADLCLALGSATGLCVLLALVVAVLRRLVLGEYDADTSDVRLPSFTHGWAAHRDDGANNTVYFLVLIFLTTIGFAALYDALALDVNHSFANFDPSLTNALYFSVITVATVGYGEVHPLSTSAKWIVMAQVSTGPMLLSWLLAVFLTSRANTAPPASLPSSDVVDGPRT